MRWIEMPQQTSPSCLSKMTTQTKLTYRTACHFIPVIIKGPRLRNAFVRGSNWLDSAYALNHKKCLTTQNLSGKMFAALSQVFNLLITAT